MIVVAYGQIVPQRILDCATVAPINIHFSLLPLYRGATPVQGALLSGDKETGTTLQFMDRGLDTGDIVYQEKITIEKDDNATVLFERLISLSIELLTTHWNELQQGKFTRTPQDETKSSYTHLINKSDLRINWARSASEIERQLKAYNNEPGVKALFREKPIFITSAFADNETPSQQKEPGAIIAVEKQALIVACGIGTLHLEQVKPAGKTPMDIRSFINGYHPHTGESWQ
jgi:methionyl-tRNA formyltransferase